VNGLLSSLRNLGPVRLGAIAAVLAATIGFFVFISTRLATPSYGLLYSELEVQDSSQIVTKLEALNVPYELRGNGSQILVPSDQVDRLRLTMAETGLPHGGSVGYEIFDKSETLGTSSFVQNVNHLRALEGELARTIGTINGVQAARVHLVLPQRELFARDKQSPSASIVIKMRGSDRLAKSRVSAIQHLVAAAVPGLHPGRVSIVDSDGNLLARGTEDDGDGSDAGANMDDRRTAYETRLGRSVEEMLERSLGPGRVRAEVHADMDFDRITTNSETYDPDGQVVRSTQTSTDSSDSSDGGDAPVTVANNLPDASAAKATAAAARSKNAKNEETVNYEISKTVKSQVREAGVVKRLSVAVLVDGVMTTAADGTKSYQPRSPDELKQLTTLVRSAIGFNADRGDTVEVVNLRFNAPDDLGAALPADGLFGFARADLLKAAEPLALALIGLLILLVVVRPLIKRLLDGSIGGSQPETRALTGPGGQQLLTGPNAGALQGQGQGQIATGVPGAAVATGAAQDSLDQMIDIGQVEGRVRASSIKKIGEIVEKHPEEAVAIVRAWMYQNA
jgi:flagellar M-ring protein FliF